MRNGKIARLRNIIRDELNLRMDNREDGATLLAWLNALPEVQETLKASFGGVPISKQNLCEWRKGGFREWQRRRDWIFEACDLNHYTEGMEEVVETPLMAGDLAALLAVRYAALLNTWDGGTNPKFERHLRLLRGVGKDIAVMQRTLHRARLQQREYYKASDDEIQEHKAKMDKIVLSPISAWLDRQSWERMFGLYVEKEQAKKLAEFVIAVKYDLPARKSAKADQPGQTQSKPVKSKMRLDPDS
jgi:hypothetical protein